MFLWKHNIVLIKINMQEKEYQTSKIFRNNI